MSDQILNPIKLQDWNHWAVKDEIIKELSNLSSTLCDTFD